MPEIQNSVLPLTSPAPNVELEVNRIADCPDQIGGITHDAINVTHDRVSSA